MKNREYYLRKCANNMIVFIISLLLSLIANNDLKYILYACTIYSFTMFCVFYKKHKTFKEIYNKFTIEQIKEIVYNKNNNKFTRKHKNIL